MIKRALIIALLITADVLTLIIVLQAAIFTRKNIMPNFGAFPEFPPIDFTYFWWIFPVWIFFIAYEGLYVKRFSFWDEVKMLWKTVFFSTLATFAILYLSKTGEQVSRTVLVLTGIIAIPVVPVIRTNVKKLLIYTGLQNSKVLILGAGETGRLIYNALRRDRNLGMNVVGFLDDDPVKVGGYIDGIKIHPGVDRAQKYIGRCGIESIVIAMPGCEKKKIVSLVNRLQHKARNIILIPDLFGITVLGTDLQHFFQDQAIGLEVKNNLARPLNIFIKKLFDLITSTVLLVLLAIPMLIIAAGIKATSPGPAIYSQIRIGRHNRPFKCYKFRTMYNDAEERLSNLLENNIEARNEWEHHWKLSNDPRVTEIGRFLRQTSLDELPQIFNVLKGDMSLVGPRPVTKQEIDEYYKDQAELCFGVPPGVTGLWQVSGRSNTAYDYRITLDSWYVRNWNLWLDIVILFKTVSVVIKKEGAV